MVCGTWHGMEEFTRMCGSIVDVAAGAQRTWHGGVRVALVCVCVGGGVGWWGWGGREQHRITVRRSDVVGLRGGVEQVGRFVVDHNHLRVLLHKHGRP